MTLTIKRGDIGDITVELVWLDDWNVLEAVDEWGRPVSLTPEEIKDLVDRAEVGEDEAGH